MKTAVLISCFHYYNDRLELVEAHLRTQGYRCLYLTADFDHIEKKPLVVELSSGEQIRTRPYRKNLSFARIDSHIAFARDAFRRISAAAPDLIYVMVPPNALAAQAAHYKRKHPQTRLIMDLYDLWPETFPNDKWKRLLQLPFRCWQGVRDVGLKHADLIFTECELYQTVLQKQLIGKRVETLPLCRKAATVKRPLQVPDCKEIALCYLGSINNIIDIPAITQLISEMVKWTPVALHVIGKGESRGVLLSSAERAGAKVLDHGECYVPSARQAVFDGCHFGLNIMKQGVCVGLTMKSLDYLAGGLPLINSIGADTQRMIRDQGAGVQLDRADMTGTARRIISLSAEEHRALRENALHTYEEYYSREAFMARLACLE